MPDYTSSALLARLRRYAAIPAQQPGYDTSDLLDFLNQHLLTVVVPTIIKNREDFFVRYVDFALPSSFDQSIAIPSRAIKLRDIKLLGGNPGVMVNIPRVDIEELNNRWGGAFPSSVNGFLLQGNSIKIINPSAYSGSGLRVYYYNRPGELIQTIQAAKVVSVGSNFVTVSSVPVSWGPGTVVDFIQGEPGFDVYDIDKSVTSITGPDIYFASGDIPASLSAGDWISLKGTSPVACIPYELWDFLVQGAVLRILESQGDMSPGYQMAVQKYQHLMSEAVSLLSPRVDGEVRVLGSAATGFI